MNICVLAPTQVDSGTVKRAYAQFRSLKYNVTNIHSFVFLHRLNVLFAFRLVRLGYDVEQSGKNAIFAKVARIVPHHVGLPPRGGKDQRYQTRAS